ncbi:MAG: phospholipid carrier-dependent glycosyltransferase [Gammaproteobacteria bacterium]
MSNATRARYFIALVLFALVWFWGLGHRPLFNTDEGRYAEIPREMLVSGDWVTPRLNNLRYFEKPPLQYWATTAAYAVFGVHDWAARLWTALCGFLTVLLAGLTAGRLYGERAGWYAAAALAGSFYFGFLAHFSTLDAGLAFAMNLTLFGFVLAQHAPPHSRAERAWMLVAYGGAALAVLSKGLIGIILPGAVLVLYLIVKREIGLLRRLHIGIGLAFFFALVLPWFIVVSIKNPDFLYQFFVVQQFLRFLTPIAERPGAWWYFFPLLLLAVLPWLAAAVRGLWRPPLRLFARGAFDPAALLWLWVVFIFAFFTISHSKLPSYILPVIPAFAVLIGRELAASRSKPWIGVAVSLLAGAVIVAAGFLAPRYVHGTDPAMLRAYEPWVIAAGALIVAATLAACALRGCRFALVGVIAAAWLVAARLILLGGAALGPEYSTRALTAEVARYNRPGVPIYSVGGYQQTLPFYLRRTMTLVAYQGEMQFGIEHARGSLADRYLPTLQDFATAWRGKREALAFVPRELMGKVQALGIHYRIVGENPDWIALVPA